MITPLRMAVLSKGELLLRMEFSSIQAKDKSSDYYAK